MIVERHLSRPSTPGGSTGSSTLSPSLIVVLLLDIRMRSTRSAVPLTLLATEAEAELLTNEREEQRDEAGRGGFQDVRAPQSDRIHATVRGRDAGRSLMILPLPVHPNSISVAPDAWRA